MPTTLAKFNTLPRDECAAILHQACGSSRWANWILEVRPFPTLDALHTTTDQASSHLTREDYLEAFAHHPRIGETSLAAPLAPTAELSSREQSGMAAASDEVRQAFVGGNHEYERRFGHVFLICATGKSADEMLAALRLRLKNDAETEFQIACGELRRIAHLRLDKLIQP